MRAWLRQHRQALALAFAKAIRTAGVLSALVIGIALALPAMGYALLDSLRGIERRITLDAEISVFLRPEAKRADADALGATLRSDARVAGARFVPREEALKDLKTDPALAEVIAALGGNPLPDAFVVTLRQRDAAMVDAVSADLRKLPAVAHVQADALWAQRLAALVGIGRLGLWLLAALLGVGLVAVVFNTIRLQVLTQRDEIEVSKLLGAADDFIRRPFYYLGLLQGLAGGAVALLVVAAGLALLNNEVADLARSYGASFRFNFLAPGDAVAVLLFASLVGWLGAYLSVNQQLRAMSSRN